MSTEISSSASSQEVAVSRPKITLLMVLCGLVGASLAGAVSAATPSDDVPSITVKFDPQSLATDSGARTLYHRLEKVAAEVCPAPFTGSRLISGAVVHCREQAVARAVHQIGNSRLAALYAHTVNSG